MRKLVSWLVLAGLLVVLGALGILWMTDGVRARGEDVVAALADGNVKHLQELMAPRMGAVISAEGLLHAAGVWGLSEAAGLEWTRRSVSTSGGELEGHFDHGDAEDVGFRLAFDRVEGEYLLRLVQVDNPWRVADPALLAVPGDAELVALANAVTRRFGRATATGDMASLHAEGSRDFRASLTVADLERSFAGFIARGIDTGPATELPWRATGEPRIDDEGVLRVAGRYPSTPVNVQFAYGFVREQDRWKLFALSVELVDPENG